VAFQAIRHNRSTTSFRDSLSPLLLALLVPLQLLLLLFLHPTANITATTIITTVTITTTTPLPLPTTPPRLPLNKIIPKNPLGNRIVAKPTQQLRLRPNRAVAAQKVIPDQQLRRRRDVYVREGLLESVAVGVSFLLTG
jgi:hypothetical protein